MVRAKKHMCLYGLRSNCNWIRSSDTKIQISTIIFNRTIHWYHTGGGQLGTVGGLRYVGVFSPMVYLVP